MAKYKINVLYVDDEVHNLNSFVAKYRRSFNIFIASSGAEGIEILKTEEIHVILSDERMPDMNGVEFLSDVRISYPKPVRVLLTAYSDLQVMKLAINDAKIFGWLDKPFSDSAIKKMVNQGYELYSAREEGKEIISQLLKINNEMISEITEQQLRAKLVIQAYENLN